MTRITELWNVFWLYRRHHSTAYAARMAVNIVFHGLPF